MKTWFGGHAPHEVGQNTYEFTITLLQGYAWATKNKKIYPHKPRTTAVIDHDIITRRTDEELLKCVGVEQMEASSTVAGSSSRAARPCAADAAPPRYPHVREEASRSGLLDPRERPRASTRRRGGKQEGVAAKERG